MNCTRTRQAEISASGWHTRHECRHERRARRYRGRTSEQEQSTHTHHKAQGTARRDARHRRRSHFPTEEHGSTSRPTRHLTPRHARPGRQRRPGAGRQGAGAGTGASARAAAINTGLGTGDTPVRGSSRCVRGDPRRRREEVTLPRSSPSQERARVAVRRRARRVDGGLLPSRRTSRAAMLVRRRRRSLSDGQAQPATSAGHP